MSDLPTNADTPESAAAQPAPEATPASVEQQLAELQAKHTCIGDIRGKGLMIGCEFVEADGSPAHDLCENTITRAYYNGLILLPCGQSTVRFMPPLLITNDDVDEAIEMLDTAITEAMAM